MRTERRLSSPYVGLIPYSEADAPFFFGREAERDTIIENLRSTRLTLLYGASGVGKSSVLHAGVVYQLRQLTERAVETYGTPEFAVLVFNAWRDDPITGLMKSVQEAIARALQVKSIEAVPASPNLAEMLKAWTQKVGAELLIILDQFEEYFIYRPEEKAEGTFAFEFPRAVNDPELRAKFLISLRDDAVSRLDRFKSQIPNIYDNMLRIDRMNTTAARAAIEKPIQAYNRIHLAGQNEARYSIEPALVDEILKQVPARSDYPPPSAENAPTSQQRTRYIETPYLQLVMTRLWEKEQASGSRVLRLSTLESLKGLKNIVQVYLNESLEKLTPEQQGIAARIFDYLVTPSGTKVAYVESDLALRTKIAPEQIAPVIAALNRDRILRSVDPPLDRPEESRWEVFHDVLAQAILNWQAQFLQTFELAEAERKRQAEALAREAKQLRRWRVILIALLLLGSAFLGYALYQRKQATDALKESETQRLAATEQKKQADEARKLSEENAEEANRQYRLAEENRKLAEKNEKEAEGLTAQVLAQAKELKATKEALAKALSEKSRKLSEREQQIQEAVNENPELADRFHIRTSTEVDPTDVGTRRAPTGDSYHGTSRKVAKLSIPEARVEQFGDLKDLIASLPSDEVMKGLGIRPNPSADRVPEEKRNVRVRAWLYAASKENDNDFHLIIGRQPDTEPVMYMTVEVSGLPPAESEFFARLKSARNAFKRFFGDKLPGLTYDFYDPPIPVEIEGALFWDVGNVARSKPGPRSLRDNIPTLWEIHPVTGIKFEQ